MEKKQTERRREKQIEKRRNRKGGERKRKSARSFVQHQILKHIYCYRETKTIYLVMIGKLMRIDGNKTVQCRYQKVMSFMMVTVIYFPITTHSIV